MSPATVFLTHAWVYGLRSFLFIGEQIFLKISVRCIQNVALKRQFFKEVLKLFALYKKQIPTNTLTTNTFFRSVWKAVLVLKAYDKVGF